MAFKIFYHKDALADLEIAFAWSSEVHPKTTEQFFLDLFNHLDFLVAFPYLGTPIKGRPNLRRLLHSPFYVYYRIHEGAIEILHFWHASRHSPKL